MFNQQALKCPLCHHQDCKHYWQDKKRDYWQCQNCSLVFVPESQHLSSKAEKAEYDKHDNTHLNEGYRRFLNRTLEPLLQALNARFTRNVIGLDFGCGEGAFLSQMAMEQGVKVENYDLFYHPNHSLLNKNYDFIVMTEVLEHLASPDIVLKNLLKQLNSNGILAIMTKRVRDQKAFTKWHYKNDPTHICFYCEATFEFISREYGLSLTIVGEDVVLLYANTFEGS